MEISVVLQRLETGDQGTFGRLFINDAPFVFTGELPWRANAPNISCIPAGTYKGTWTFSPRFKRFMYLIEPVTKRTGIRIHSANFMGDLELGFRRQLNGCISMGERLGHINNQKAVLLSQPAIRKFEAKMNWKTFFMEIRNAY